MDKAHSSVTFKIRHVVSKVDGQFKDFSGKMWLDRENPAASKVEFTIQAASLDTRNENRDKHLRSADFFDAEKYPTITFKSTRVVSKGKDVYDVTGDLTIRGVTKSLTTTALVRVSKAAVAEILLPSASLFEERA